MADETQGNGAAGASGGPNFAVHKIYLKDASLETPHSPEIFQADWRPEANVELNTRHKDLGNDTWEVVVQVTVTAKLGDQTAYLCEAQEAGIFGLSGFDAETLDGLLGSYCPGMIFPFVREAVSDLTSKAGFPPMLLAPVNFDMLYAQKQARKQQEQGASAGGEAS